MQVIGNAGVIIRMSAINIRKLIIIIHSIVVKLLQRISFYGVTERVACDWFLSLPSASSWERKVSSFSAV
jgi:hypothetical protein